MAKRVNSSNNILQDISELSIISEYLIPDHPQGRCACFACRNSQFPKEGGGLLVPRDAEPWDYADSDAKTGSKRSKLSSTPANTGFYSKTSSQVTALTLDSLAALNSPYISGTFVGAKWGTEDPD